MIIDPLRLALVISPAEVDDDDGAAAALVPVPAEVDNDDGVGVTEFKGVDVMEAGAAVDVAVPGAAGRR